MSKEDKKDNKDNKENDDLQRNGAFVALTTRKDRSDLVIIRDSDPKRHGLSLPGGGQKAGELINDTATREAKEETGLEAKDLKQIGTLSYLSYSGTVNLFVGRGVGTPWLPNPSEVRGIEIVPIGIINLEDFQPYQKTLVEYYLLYLKALRSGRRWKFVYDYMGLSSRLEQKRKV